MLSRKIKTAQGNVSLLESDGAGMPVLLIHGNSSSREVFQRQFEANLAKVYRLIALDLLGHGRSDNAHDPKQAYTVPGYAATAIEVLHALKIDHAALLGWSLGGHIGLEMLGQGYGAAGVMIVGTPPITRGFFGMMRGFQSQFDLLLATKSVLRQHEIARFASICVGSDRAPDYHRAIARTDPRARPILSRGMMMGVGSDQRWIVEHLPTPIAVVNGSQEPFARLDYLESVAYANLWDGQCHIIEGAGHAPFLETPERFNSILQRVLEDVSKRRTEDMPSRTVPQVA